MPPMVSLASARDLPSENTTYAPWSSRTRLWASFISFSSVPRTNRLWLSWDHVVATAPGFVSAPSTRPYPTFPFLPYRSKTTARESPADFQSSTPSFTSTLRFTGVVAVPKVPIFMTLTSAHFASGSSAFNTKSEISAGRQLIVW